MKKIIGFIIISLCLAIIIGCRQNRDDTEEPTPTQETPEISRFNIENGGFETGDLTGWTVVSGEAFEHEGVSSATQDIAYSVLTNKDGQFFYGRHKENQVGRMRSSVFEIGGSGWISFKLGGAKNTALMYLSVKEETTDIELARFGHTMFNSSTQNQMADYREANLVQYKADLSFHFGKKAYIEAVDESRRDWGLMTLDSIVTYHETEPLFQQAYVASDLKPQFDILSASYALENQDFSEGNLSGWTVAYGNDAFKDSHVRSVGSNRYRLINRANESSVGVLRSSAFLVGGTAFVSFRLGAMHTNNRDHIYLSVKRVGTNEEVFRTYNSRGRFQDEEGTHLYFIDLEAYRDQYLYVEIVDNATADWGLVILESLQTHYPVRPFVRDEIAMNLLALGKTERTYAIMRAKVQEIIENMDVEAFIPSTASPAQQAFYREHFKTIFEKTFFATIDGFDVISPIRGNLSFPGVNQYLEDGTTFTITGDIPAMWLRDSPAQILQYLHFANDDPDVREMTKGMIQRLFMYIRLDPYANAFNKDGTVWERKFEVDSLCYPIWLAYRYYQITGDDSIFDKYFMMTVETIVDTFIQEQNHSDAIYDIWNIHPTDKMKYPNEVALGIGLIWNGYRPSDDVTKYKYLIPSNMFAVVILGYIQEIYTEKGLDQAMANKVLNLKNQVRQAIETYGTYQHPTYGKIYAYEVDGLGNYNLMDDANIPSLLSAPWLGYVGMDDPVYLNTRQFILSGNNPFYFQGTHAKGIGSEHTPNGYVWPMAFAMQMMTTSNRQEIKEALMYQVLTTAGTFVMHEGFHVNDPSIYSREWFTWPCALFAEAVLTQFLFNQP